MKKAIRPLVMGNWKMNPLTTAEAKQILSTITKGTKRADLVDVVIAPPDIYLETASKLVKATVFLGAQTVSQFRDVGAHTSETSLAMLQQFGVSHIILGHSERRALGTTDEEVVQKMQAVLAGRGVAVVCVGERERDEVGEYFSFVEAQLKAVLTTVPQTKLKNLVIAYEPIWAIGTGNTATAADVYEMKLFIQKVIADTIGRAAAKKIRIIYGGSVKAKNADELLAVGEVDGFLVGGASLQPEEFISIVNSAQLYAKE